MTPIKVFLDSDVIITSLLSDKGASHFLIHSKESRDLELVITDFSTLEIKDVMRRHRIDDYAFEMLLGRIKVEELNQDLYRTQPYESYVSDKNDVHVLAGARQVGARFLATFNIRDFKPDKISSDFGIQVVRPASILQYLRSLR